MNSPFLRKLNTLLKPLTNQSFTRDVVNHNRKKVCKINRKELGKKVCKKNSEELSKKVCKKIARN